MTALAEAQARGQARLIGVSNFTIDHPRARRGASSARARSPPTRSRSTPTCRRRSSATTRADDGLPLTAYQPLARGQVARRPGARARSASGTASRPRAVALAFLMAEGPCGRSRPRPARRTCAPTSPRADVRLDAGRDRRDPRARPRPARASIRPSRRSGTTDMGSVDHPRRAQGLWQPSRCCTASPSTSPTASSWCWSAPPAAASPRFCA